MDYKLTNQEWAEVLRPLLAQAHKRSVRRKLCRLHRNGPVKEGKVQCPWADGRNAFATINGNGMKLWLLSPDGSSAYVTYNADGNQVDAGHTGHALDGLL